MKREMETIVAVAMMCVGCFLLGRISKDNKPHPQLKTKRDRIKELPPKITVCLMCDEAPQPGSYFCAACEKIHVKA